MKVSQENGFSLIEVLVVIAVSATLMGAVYSLFVSQIRLQGTHVQMLDLQQNIRATLYMMEQEIRMAGFKGNAVNVSPGFTAANPTSMTFSYVCDFDDIDNDNDGTVDENGESVTVQYSLVDTDGDSVNDALTRTLNGGTPTPIAENVANVEFYYSGLDNDGDLQEATDPTSLSPTMDLANIRTVTITILAKSQKSIRGITSDNSFTTPSNVIWTSGSIDDGFYRRLVSLNIIIRNAIL